MRVGLVGCGAWGKHILRDLRALGCDVPVVARSEASVARAGEVGAKEIVEHVGALVGLDGVVVATGTATHAAVVAEALQLGVPVFVEKPLTDDPATARALAERAPDRLFVMDKWRYHPGVRELAAIARDGRLGAIRALRTVRVGWGNPHDDVDAVWVLAPHDLSIALEVLGAVPEPLAASAETIDGEVVSLTGLLRAGDVPHTLDVSAYAPQRDRRVELRCEDGVAVLGGGWDEHVSLFRPDENGVLSEETVPTPGELPLLAELRAFVEHLAGGPPPASSAAEGAETVVTIARLRRLAGLDAANA